MMDKAENIVHICTKANWQEAISSGTYQPQSLELDGFIHFSKPSQVLSVANTFYSGVGDLLLLWIDIDKLTHELRWEKSDGEIFPHLYGSLNLDAVLTGTDFLPDKDGIFRKLPVIG